MNFGINLQTDNQQEVQRIDVLEPQSLVIANQNATEVKTVKQGSGVAKKKDSPSKCSID